MVDVLGVEKRDEDVHIEERSQDFPQGSSSILSTSSELTGREPSRGGNKGTPFRIVPRSSLRPSALRANSESILPAVVLRRAASSFAARNTSSSISNVVRMTNLLYHQPSDV